MNLVSSKRAIFFALIFALAASLAFAQSDLGSISGFVKDPSGSTVPGAKVTVRNQSGLERQAIDQRIGLLHHYEHPAADVHDHRGSRGIQEIRKSKQ